LIASFGDIPLVYMGDEIGLLNDHDYMAEHPDDSRWLHRPRMDWDRADEALQGKGTAGRIYAGVRAILRRRAATPELHAAYPTLIADTGRDGLFGFVRKAPANALVCIFNFTEFWTTLRHEWALSHGASLFEDALSGERVDLDAGRILLPPYARVWLR
jgi:amylosucrase